MTVLDHVFQGLLRDHISRSSSSIFGRLSGQKSSAEQMVRHELLGWMVVLWVSIQGCLSRSWKMMLDKTTRRPPVVF